jgi:hypothetical protein
MSRKRIISALALLLAGFCIGAVAGGSVMERATWAIADEEAEERAHCARALWRVAERHIGHDRLIVEWRSEISATRVPVSPMTAEGRK